MHISPIVANKEDSELEKNPPRMQAANRWLDELSGVLHDSSERLSAFLEKVEDSLQKISPHTAVGYWWLKFLKQIRVRINDELLRRKMESRPPDLLAGS